MESSLNLIVIPVVKHQTNLGTALLMVYSNLGSEPVKKE